MFIFFSCSKDQSIFIPDQTFIINSDILLSKFVSDPTSLIVELKKGKTTVAVTDNLIVDIPYESLITTSDEKVVGGEIKVVIKEYADEKYNLLRSPSLIYNEQFIHSKKMVYINFSQNGQLLKIAKPINVYLKDNGVDILNTSQLLTSQNSDNSTVWYAENNANFKIKAGDWVINNEEAIITLRGYKLEVNNNNTWFCIADLPIGQSLAQQQISVPFDDKINQHNTIAFFIADESNTVVKLHSGTENQNFYLKFAALAEHVPGKLVFFSQFDYELYHFGMTNVVLGRDAEVNVTSAPKEIKEIKAILASL